MEKEITDLPVREESPNVSILIEERKIAIEVSWLDAPDEFEIRSKGVGQLFTTLRIVYLPASSLSRYLAANRDP